MHCSLAQTSLQPFLLGELDPGMMRGVQMHLRGCAQCRGGLARVREYADVVVPFYLVGLSPGQLAPDQRSLVESHLTYCEPCGQEYQYLSTASDELVKNLSQYQLGRSFPRRVMQEWHPHRAGKPVRFGQRGMADMIERAEAGNTFSYERLVERYRDYAYLAAYLQVKEFQWAGEIAREIFTRGLPTFPAELTHVGLLEWFLAEAEKSAEAGGWLGAGESLDDKVTGLSGYHRSRKLRRHRLILDQCHSLEPVARMPFLLFYVQRLSYIAISSLLEISEVEVIDVIARSTRMVAEKLRADEQDAGLRQ